ncbi:FAD-binding 9 siderophore-interacting domain protein [Gluconacetobacter diazotrophicus PA1 5]|uniref:siderophore-interacting protein n=1 Tax=Gluconacetobacter diazotrophicus TaxID=33996 RepID=UPI000181EFDE|nr:siderophore-interacting protein [Gluconacetobacter diazotrophicus]ACI50909.1 FAD-binding 9 siderophore-interacting domain protein [Gluconacetobacter diazotrophicus PA1 5]TWB08636.1 NADPH-dependent ferric siderophore reductase [Gluconacetobacter diazotrophicus]
MNALSSPAPRARPPVRLRMMQVVRVEDLSPRMRRVVFTGPDLADFRTAAADDHVKLFFPAPGQDRPVLPAIGPDGRPVRDPAVPVIARDYTPRRFDPACGELSIEFVLHGDGPATSWAAQAAPGQWLGVGGPRGSFVISGDHAGYLLIGDETALPAIARRLEELPAGTTVTALIEVEDAAEERRLSSAADARVLWLPRAGAPAGRSPVLLDALRRLALDTRTLHVWIGAEIETVRALRTYLIEEEAIPRDRIRAAGYWRLGTSNGGERIRD